MNISTCTLHMFFEGHARLKIHILKTKQFVPNSYMWGLQMYDSGSGSTYPYSLKAINVSNAPSPPDISK